MECRGCPIWLVAGPSIDPGCYQARRLIRMVKACGERDAGRVVSAIGMLG